MENIENFLKGKEGCLLEAYDDKQPKKKLQPEDKIKGTITIGYGTTGYINGEKIDGLINRRAAEKELFFKDFNKK